MRRGPTTTLPAIVVYAALSSVCYRWGSDGGGCYYAGGRCGAFDLQFRPKKTPYSAFAGLLALRALYKTARRINNAHAPLQQTLQTWFRRAASTLSASYFIRQEQRKKNEDGFLFCCSRCGALGVGGTCSKSTPRR